MWKEYEAARQRRAELLEEAERRRLARLVRQATRGPSLRERWLPSDAARLTEQPGALPPSGKPKDPPRGVAMKLVVFGATGGTGLRLIEQALAQGHEVTVIARRPSDVAVRNRRLEVARGDVLESSTIEGPVAGKDAVISLVGTSQRAPTTLYSEGTANIVRAMWAGGARRLLCVSADAIELSAKDPPLQRLVSRYVVQPLLRHPLADMMRMEEVVKSSELDWTLFRPPRLTNGPQTSHYRTAVDQHLRAARFISRSDLAECILERLCDPAAVRAVVSVAY
jgi:putative NADH-flavin reductase